MSIATTSSHRRGPSSSLSFSSATSCDHCRSSFTILAQLGLTQILWWRNKHKTINVQRTNALLAAPVTRQQACYSFKTKQYLTCRLCSQLFSLEQTIKITICNDIPKPTFASMKVRYCVEKKQSNGHCGEDIRCTGRKQNSAEKSLVSGRGCWSWRLFFLPEREDRRCLFTKRGFLNKIQ